MSLRMTLHRSLNLLANPHQPQQTYLIENRQIMTSYILANSDQTQIKAINLILQTNKKNHFKIPLENKIKSYTKYFKPENNDKSRRYKQLCLYFIIQVSPMWSL